MRAAPQGRGASAARAVAMGTWVGNDIGQEGVARAVEGDVEVEVAEGEVMGVKVGVEVAMVVEEVEVVEVVDGEAEVAGEEAERSTTWAPWCG